MGSRRYLPRHHAPLDTSRNIGGSRYSRYKLGQYPLSGPSRHATSAAHGPDISIVGGIWLFGIGGLILGPIVFALTQVLLDIWRER